MKMSDRSNPVAKAIHETNTNITIAKAETRKRKFWAYITPQELAKWADTQDWSNNVIPTEDVLIRLMFGTALDAVVKRGTQGKTEDFAGNEMLAVWRKVDPPLEGQEPDFDDLDQSAMSDSAVTLTGDR